MPAHGVVEFVAFLLDGRADGAGKGMPRIYVLNTNLKTNVHKQIAAHRKLIPTRLSFRRPLPVIFVDLPANDANRLQWLCLREASNHGKQSTTRTSYIPSLSRSGSYHASRQRAQGGFRRQLGLLCFPLSRQREATPFCGQSCKFQRPRINLKYQTQRPRPPNFSPRPFQSSS